MKKKIGIVGGGQLGMFMGESAKKLGFDVHILENNTVFPAKDITDVFIQGNVKDEEKIIELSKDVDYMTFEIESANAEALQKIQKKNILVNPTPETLELIKDKFSQKMFFKNNNLPVGEFSEISDMESAQKIGARFGYPFLLKARFDSYDGKGNAVVHSEDEIENAMKELGGKNLYAEKFVNFSRELSVVAVRSIEGEIKTYRTVETFQKNNICHKVHCPAEISEKIEKKCEKIASDVLELFSGAGVFGIEMFLTADENILINEIAPRVHNSGHHTLESSETGQFENHIRAISHLPLGSTAMKFPCAVMINILGQNSAEKKAYLKGKDSAELISGITVHWYNKEYSRFERKMGHITAVADTLSTAEENAKKALDLLSF